MSLTEKERAIRQKLKDNFPHYAEKCLKIRPKGGEIEPLILNKAQRHIHERLEKQLSETGKIRALILKGRQQGCSTYTEGRFYWKVTYRKGVRAFILTHEDAATANLFEMAQRYHEHCPAPVKPRTGATNAKELKFDLLDSGYKVGTAGTKGVGRSGTVQYFHGSEVAYWPHADEHAKGVIQSIPDMPGTEVILESTANGIGNYFHQQWQAAEAGLSDYIAIFVPWYWQEEYTKPVPDDFQLTEEEEILKKQYGLTQEQLNWRRYKTIELSTNGQDGAVAFKQEYPFTSVEAFLTSGEDAFIDNEAVLAARKTEGLERIGPLLLGVDPARYGDDRTSMIFRQGRVAFGLKSTAKKSTMETAGTIHHLIREHNRKGTPIHRVLIDVGGLGAGIVDRLREMGHTNIVVPVNFGGRPSDPARFVIKRDEMWGEMADWLEDGPVEIPDVDSLHADLCGPKKFFDSKHRRQVERKELTKKRGLLSPDESEALGLTFAFGATHIDYGPDELLPDEYEDY